VTFQKISLWIPMPAALRALRVLVLVAAHPKLWIFVQLCAWPMLSLGPKPPLAHYPEFKSVLQQICSKSSSTSEKNSLLRLFRTLHVSRVPNNTIVIPQVDHQALCTCFHMEFIRFTPPLCSTNRVTLSVLDFPRIVFFLFILILFCKPFSREFKFPSSIIVVIPTLQTTVVFYKLSQFQLLSVLQDFLLTKFTIIFICTAQLHMLITFSCKTY
jgi:hypothetical protein